MNKCLLSIVTLIFGSSMGLAQIVEMDTIYLSKKFEYSSSLKESVIYIEKQSYLKLVQKDSTVAIRTAPANHDYMNFIPDIKRPNEKGRLILNHELNNYRTNYPELGEGGGMSIVPVIKVGDQWIIDVNANPELRDTAKAVDFSTVGWTTTNCGGFLMGNGNHATAEEIFSNFRSNMQIRNRHDTLQKRYGYNGDGTYTIPSDYPEFGGHTIRMHENFGWMVEVDPDEARAVRKLYHMGRFSHEGGIAMKDGRTVYLTDDFYPAVLFKFVADGVNDYSTGNLYAFKQDDNSPVGEWIQIERELDSLINARDVALRKGATIFMRLEWAADIDGIVYIAETGWDNRDVSGALSMGAKPAYHWVNPTPASSISWDPIAGIVDHPYGTVLALDDSDPKRPVVKSFLEGGNGRVKPFNFTNVDCIRSQRIMEKDWLVLHEDMNRRDRNRMPDYNQREEVNELFLLDMTIQDPTVDDLFLVCAGSQGAELTGGCFTPDGNTLFINNQHPSDRNAPPYNETATIALTGFSNQVTAISRLDENVEAVQVYPNPVFGEIHFNKVFNVAIFSSSGQLVRSAKGVQSIFVHDLSSATYLLRLEKDGEIYTKTIIKL